MKYVSKPEQHLSALPDDFQLIIQVPEKILMLYFK